MSGRTVGPPLVGFLDEVWERIRARFGGLTEDEHRWEPVPGCWTVRPTGDGRFVADRVRPEPDPPPVTTIAWRLWHIGSDCLESYSDGAFGTTALGLAEGEWVGTVDEALAAVDAAWSTFRTGVVGLGEDGLWRPLGPSWGPFAESSHAQLVLHAADELVHHGAEIALLRDLHRAGFTAPTPNLRR